MVQASASPYLTKLYHESIYVTFFSDYLDRGNVDSAGLEKE